MSHYDSARLQFNPTAAGRLAVVLHGFAANAETMDDVVAATTAAYQGNVDIYLPANLSYRDFLDPKGADAIILRLVADLDEIWRRKTDAFPVGYDSVVLIGHSLGGVLLRRLFLAGSLNSDDYSGVFEHRDELIDRLKAQRGASKDLPCDWAPKVDRLVLLASWDKGWSVSPRTGWITSIGLNALGVAGRLTELVERIVDPDGGFARQRPAGQGRIGQAVQRSSEYIAEKRQSAGAWLTDYKPARTMLDVRQGARFIVQTRLLWMAYRRWHDKEVREAYNRTHPQEQQLSDPETKRDASGARLTSDPLVVQIVGALDDFVSPQEQIDLDAEGARAWARAKDQATDPDKRKFFLLEMADAKHEDVIDFVSGSSRAELFAAALTYDRKSFDDALADASNGNVVGQAMRNPVDFLDAPPVIDEKIEDVVFVIHGIRDDGNWTHRVAAGIKRVWANNAREASAQVPVQALFCPTWTHTYGYFPMLAFILPWVRMDKVEWFMDKYVSVRSAYPAARLHYVGHSNGTYICAAALKDYPAARFGNVYFAGSVVHPQYDWKGCSDKKRVQKFHNARGGEDWVVALLPKSLEYFTDLGGGGFDGFDESEAQHWPGHAAGFTQSENFAKGGHGGAIGEKHWPEIAKFIVKGETPFSQTEMSSGRFAKEQDGLYKFFGALRIGLPIAFGFVGLLTLWLTSLFAPLPGSLGAPASAWVLWLAASGAAFAFARKRADERSKPIELGVLGLVGGVGFVFLVLWSALLRGLIGWPGLFWGLALLVFMIVSFVSDRGKGLQRAPSGPQGVILLFIFVGLVLTYLLWLIGGFYSVFEAFGQFGNCPLNAGSRAFMATLVFLVAEVALFTAALYRKKLAPLWLREQFPKRFIYTAVALLFAWLGGLYLIYAPYSVACPDQFQTTSSAVTVAVLLALLGTIRFILLRV